MEQDRDRRNRILRASAELKEAKSRAGNIVEYFVIDGDFASFLDNSFYGALKMKEKYESNSLSLAMYVTDQLAKDWPEGNQIIIEEAENRGIKPSNNLFGERLEAMDCLRQVLNKPPDEHTP